MDTKIIQVFYGENYLPYKDSTRTTDFPIVGNVMLGSNNVCKIRFYVRDIGGVENATWVANTKLPNGKILFDPLSVKNYDTTLNEYYIEFDLSSLYTNVKGNLTISLSGYEGEIQLVQDSETGIYEIYGTPLVATTGSIRLAVNYTVQIVSTTTIPFSDLQLILASLAKKNDIYNSVVVLDTLPDNLLDYQEGQIFYFRDLRNFYILDSGNLVVYNMIDALTVEDTDYVIPIGDR